ncbi:MAG TPA: hypothetical protein VGB70_12435 [Allosphingosinicella sp.]|jgi:hypothetical protein
MAERNNESDRRSSRNSVLGAGLAAATAVAGGLFLWRRGRGAQAEESTAEEVQAHPS